MKILESTALELAFGPQDLALRTASKIVPGIELEPARRNDFAWSLFSLGGNDGFDLAILKHPEHLGVGIAGIHRRDADRPAGGRSRSIEPSGDHHTLIFLAGRDLDVDNDTCHVIDGSMLLVGRFEAAIAAVRGHRGVRVGHANFLEPAGLSALAERFIVGIDNRFYVADGKRIPAHMRADQGGVEMDNLSGRDLRGDAGLNRAFEDPAKTLGTPALANARQRRMIGQSLMQPVTNKPADRDIDRRLTHQSPVMDNAEQETCQHQANCNLGINARSAVVGAVEISNIVAKPGKVENSIDPNQDMLVRNKLAKRS